MSTNRINIESEATLISQLQAGDQEAFRQVVSLYHPKLLAIARAIVGEAFADEVVQDSWVAALKAIHDFEGRSALRTWLIQIVSNRAKTRLKRENRHVSLDEGWHNPDENAFDDKGRWSHPPKPWHNDSPEALLSSSELREVIQKTFDGLPYNQRAVMSLHDMEGFGFDEICNILDVSQSNVRVLLHRARLTIRKAIAEYQEQ
ncbi:RNA polymerase sigma factor [Methylophaga sp. OBS4]|uniref:RNA polymerase sigma factor n=1 Tax=Methylophaga sp. OBS4 TaxID=2991935 RepID=UPI002257E506|nr:RNA polymerase sigma factor [Methylophaga sp. OBS4]MCX4186527.1 RNA polymerase sigma factor [Methylophaga sp. OBS4]